MKKTIIRMMVLVAVIMALFSGMLVQAATTGRQRAVAVEKVIRHRYKRVKILNGDDSPEFWHKIENRKGKRFYYVEKTTGEDFTSVECEIRHGDNQTAKDILEECQKDELEFMVSEFASDEAMAKLDQLKERLEMMED